ncbi:hypothetical protein IFR05_010468 [Cadophora sp. M221]|nr:hypothetical protein IFR05_010468 [Cadophora sp. M221]
MSQTNKPTDNGDPKSDGTPNKNASSGKATPTTPSKYAPSEAGATGGYESGGETGSSDSDSGSDSSSESGLSGGGTER